MSNYNFKKVRQILLIILVANIIVAILKVMFGLIIQSVSLTTDGIHSLADGSSNVVGLIGIYFASKPKDREHPYGHTKFETLSALFIAAMLLFVGVKVVISAFYRWQNPIVPQISVLSLSVLVITLLINVFVAKVEYKKGKELNSVILVSDSMHTKSDIYVSLGVLATLLSIKMGFPPVVDIFASLVVAGFVIHAGYEIIKENSGVLVDKATVDTERIKEVVMKFDKVKDTHNIRSRGNHDNLYIDMHIVIEPNLNVEESHKLVHDIENAIKFNVSKNAQVMAHLEPYREAKYLHNF